jgi:hypothetical protein
MTYTPNLDELERQDPGWYGAESDTLEEVAATLEPERRRARPAAVAAIISAVVAGAITYLAVPTGEVDLVRPSSTVEETTTTLGDPASTTAPAPAEAVENAPTAAPAVPAAIDPTEDVSGPLSGPTAAPTEETVAPAPPPAPGPTTSMPPEQTTTTLHPSATTTAAAGE